MQMVDEIVAFGDYDPELAEGLKWLDGTEKFGINISFYDKVYRCLAKYDVETKAMVWRNKKLEDLSK